jgi:hypothetical protein
MVKLLAAAGSFKALAALLNDEACASQRVFVVGLLQDKALAALLNDEACASQRVFVVGLLQDATVLQ